MIILNTPESIIHGRMTIRERIEYQFSVFGRVLVLVIEMKIILGAFDERLDAIAPVIAECDSTH
jgi:hypothetical protein